jgi:glutamine cyclotransferase
MSDGTYKLYFLDPETSGGVGSIEVYEKGAPMSLLHKPLLTDDFEW